MTINANTIQLPLFEDKFVLPTGKHHISYSELSVFNECSYRHKLKYVNIIDLDKPSIHTEFGHVIHDIIEKYIVGEITDLNDSTIILETKNKFLDICENVLEKEYQINLDTKDIQEFCDSIPHILSSFPEWINEQFPGWKPIAKEYPLYESINGQTNNFFKGFIDIAIEVPKKERKCATKKKKDSPVIRLSELLNKSFKEKLDNKNVEHYILDLKTCSFGWRPEQKRDFKKQLQLILYKHYYCRKMNLDLKQVKCGFVLLKRIPRKSDGSCIELVPVSVGPKTETKAIDILNKTINLIRSGRTLKNRSACRFCEYFNTKHCI